MTLVSARKIKNEFETKLCSVFLNADNNNVLYFKNALNEAYYPNRPSSSFLVRNKL